MAKNGNRAKRKCHTSFFAFHILDLKSVPDYSELNSTPGNQTHFFKKMGVVPRKAAKLEKIGSKFEKKRLLTPQSSRPGNGGNLFGLIVTFLNGIRLDLELHNCNLVQKIPK